MGRCPKCGGFNEMQGNGLCRTCSQAAGDQAVQDRNRQLRDEQSSNRLEREAKEAEAQRRVAMTPEQRKAEDRQVRHAFFRPLRMVISAVLVIAIIVGAFFGINFVKELIVGNGAVYEMVYSKLLEKYEAHPDIVNDAQTELEPGIAVINGMKDELKDSDYYLRLFTNGNAEIQKYTLGGETRYYFSFSSEFDELSDKKYAIVDGLIYEKGKEEKVYAATSDDYADLLEKLNAYLPENCLGKGPFTSESRLDSAEDDISAMIAYGDNITALYDSQNGFYFEKTATLFARLEYCKSGDIDSMMNLPDLSEYLIAE